MIRPHQKYVGDCCGEKPLPTLNKVEESQSSQSATGLRRPDSSDADHEPPSESSESDDGPMDYETLRPFKSCTIKSRNSRDGFNHEIDSGYKCLEDFPQGEEVVIEQADGGDAWATTRLIKVFVSQAEQCQQCMSPIFQPWTARRS